VSVRVPIIELHPSYRPRDQIKEDAGDRVQYLNGKALSLSWSHSVNQPWEAIQLTFQFPRRGWTTFGTGDWLVLRDPDTGKAMSWGFINDVNGSMQAGSGIKTNPVSVVTSSWLDVLGRTSVYVSPGLQSLSYATMFRYEDWDLVVESLFSTLDGNIGRSLADVFEFLLLDTMYLPPSMRGEAIGDAIRVVHDVESSKAYAPNAVVDPVRGPSLMGMNSINPTGTSAMDLILSTFVPAHNMLELFPTLEEPGIPGLRDVDLAVDPKTDIVDPDKMKEVMAINARIAYTKRRVKVGQVVSPTAPTQIRSGTTKETVFEPVGGSRPASRTGRYLGLNPVLVYRMRPWRTHRTLSEWAELYAPPGLVGLAFDLRKRLREGRIPDRHIKIANRIIKAIDIDDELFQGITWRPDLGYQVDRGEVYSVSWGMSDLGHVNAVTVGLPTQPDSVISFMENAGLPIFTPDDLRVSGLRLYRPPWPFYAPVNPDKQENKESTKDAGQQGESPDSLLRHMRTVAVQAAQFMGGAAKFMTGEVTCRYRPDIRAGKVITMELPDGGTWKHITGYVETVTHTVHVDGPTVRGRTAVTFTRGLPDVSEDLRPAMTMRGAPVRGRRRKLFQQMQSGSGAGTGGTP